LARSCLNGRKENGAFENKLSKAGKEWLREAEESRIQATVRGLLAELGRSARGVKNAKQVVQDLSTLEDDLVQAEENKVRFHFVMLD